MIFLALTDVGIDTSPIVAADYQSAVAIATQRYGTGTGSINVALLLPQVVGTITQNPNPASATFAQSGDAATQAQIFSKAQTALTNNATYLAITSPTTAQAVSQVKALTQQIDGVIRLLVANFSGTT